jgi:hypothetical protein
MTAIVRVVLTKPTAVHTVNATHSQSQAITKVL